MPIMITLIAQSECIVRHVYRIHSRNLMLGVYDGRGGFLGIREKFDHRYVFTEYHRDTGPPLGTVGPVEDLGLIDDLVPRGKFLRLKESLEFIYCAWCGDILKAVPVDGKRIPWEHTTIQDCQQPRPEGRDNAMLFEALTRIEKGLRRAEDDRVQQAGS